MDDLHFDARLTALLASHSSETDFAALCALYRAADSAQRGRLRASVPPTFGYGNWAMPDRYALATQEVPLAVATNRLRDLLTWSAAFPSDDFRDDLVALAPLYHSAVRLGLDPYALFDEAASMAGTPEAAALIRGFPRRQPEDKSLAAFLLTETPTPEGGVRYAEAR
jgi:hypothetical protein